MKRLSVSCFLLGWLFVSNQLVAIKDPERTFSINTGYFTPMHNRAFSNSNRGLSFFFQETQMAYGALFDLIRGEDSSVTRRTLMTLLNIIPNMHVSSMIDLAYHEAGHARAAQAFGCNYVFDLPGSKSPIVYFFKVLIHGTYTPYVRPIGIGESDVKSVFGYLPERPIVFNPKGIDMDHFVDVAYLTGVAAGVNNAMRLAGDLSDNIYHEKGHITDAFTYVFGKTNSWMYPGVDGGDMAVLLSLYRRQDLYYNKKDFDNSNKIALFASASTYSYLWSWVNFIDTGETRVLAPVWRGVRLPDVESYLLMQGISYKIKSGVQVSDVLEIPVAVEFVGKGHRGVEVTLGASYLLKQLHGVRFFGNVLAGRKLGGCLGVHMPFERYFVEAMVETMHLDSYYGQRNIPDVKDGKRDTAFLLRAGLSY